MKIIARVKDKRVTCGYIVTQDDIQKYISSKNMINCKPTNAVRLSNGEWKATDGNSISTIDKNKVDIIINNRNSKIVGKPNLIYNYSFAKLSGTQKFLLSELEKIGKNKLIIIDKKTYNKKVTMKDLSALTAYRGIEFSLFERSDKYALIMGTNKGINISVNDVALISNGRYKWIGHTHPGNDFNCLTPSDGDYDVLKRLNQKKSTIYNSVNMHYVFGEEDEI